MALNQDDITRVSVRLKNDTTGDVMNVFYLKANVAAADTDSAIMDAIETWLDTAYSNLDILSDENVPFDFKVDVVSKTGGVIVINRHLGTRAWTITSPPAGASDPFPQGCAGIINFASASPFVKGRKYIGTWTETAATGDTFTAGSVADMVSFASDVLSDVALAVALLEPGVISLVRDGPLGDGFYQLFSAVVNPIVGYLRKRKRGSGS